MHLSALCFINLSTVVVVVVVVAVLKPQWFNVNISYDLKCNYTD